MDVVISILHFISMNFIHKVVNTSDLDHLSSVLVTLRQLALLVNTMTVYCTFVNNMSHAQNCLKELVSRHTQACVVSFKKKLGSYEEAAWMAML